ncbi:MAG: type II toxin-antitoxin system RatA family toxin [Pseudomonadota bacterium]|nr:ubiquinone-binding protein [Alphaproteobacteria bacterium]
MPRHEQKRLLPFTCDQMFDLVADIPRYPEFLPWCAGARITRRERLGNGQEVVLADLIIGYKAFRGTYTSRVVLDRAAGQIRVDHERGPFRHLHNQWIFLPQADGSCEVDFVIDFEFSNPVIRRLMDLVFTEAVSRMVQAFEARALALYQPVNQKYGTP